MKIEIGSEELVCLLFWYSYFSDNTEYRVIDRELFERLRSYLELDSGVSPKEFGISGGPWIKPEEK